MTVSLTHIQEAAARIAPIAARTPVLRSRTFDELAGVEVFFKCENFQRGGAFKIRGAANVIFSLPEARRRNGVVAYSSGNHAQAVAIAARHIGIPATIVMPSDAPPNKLAATRGYGAEVVLYDRLTEDRVVIGERIAQERGAEIVPPYDHFGTIAGQGTCALEFLEQVPDLDALVVPIGGGGLISGCATAARALKPDIRVYGVEPEAGNDTFLSLAAGKHVHVSPPDTIADGLRSQTPGLLTLPIVQSLVERVVLVSDDEIVEAVRFLLFRMKILVEPSGAVGPAALLAGKLRPGRRRVGIILSGGNLDPALLARL